MPYRDIHIFVSEFPSHCLGYADNHDVGAGRHEGDVQVGGVHIHPGRLVLVPTRDLEGASESSSVHLDVHLQK